MTIETKPDLSFLSELYVQDAPNACLLPEYPSSNSDETYFQNKSQFIIHDPFPPPRRELLKILGPHHLMCGWGRHIAVSSEIAPPDILLDHWENVLGPAGFPSWHAFDPSDSEAKFITLFPHQSIAPEQQVIAPDVNYSIHSKEVIEKIDCPQAKVLNKITPPCIVKLSHGYAGLGNFLIRRPSDEIRMEKQLLAHWPSASVVVNSVIENVVGDFGVQFYLHKNGDLVWLGFTEQHFDSMKKWCGGTFSADLQQELYPALCSMIEPAGKHLHQRGYFGVVGIDILRNKSGEQFLVDVNPRLTGITPFLMASRIFARRGMGQGVYQASRQFKGSLEQLIHQSQLLKDAQVLIHSAFEDASGGEKMTTCHLSASSHSQAHNQKVLHQLIQS